MVKNYELTYLIVPELSDEQAKSYHEKIGSFILEDGGIVGNQILPQKRTLAYNINKKGSAFMATFIFKGEPAVLDKLAKKIKEEEQILRHIILEKITRKEKIKSRAKIHAENKKEHSAKEENVIRHREFQKTEMKDIDKKIEEILNT